MSGFDSAFHEQPVNMIGMGIGPVSLPGMNIPHGYIGPDARPCGGYGGFDAAVKESIRLQDAAWNSVTTNDIHETWRKPIADPLYFMPKIPKMPEIDYKPIRTQPENLIDQALDMFYGGREKRQQAEREHWEQIKPLIFPEIVAAQIQRQRGPLTVYEQTGDSHISHVRGKGYHVTTQVPGIGKDVGLDQTLSFHTYVELDRKGRLRFDSDY